MRLWEHFDTWIERKDLHGNQGMLTSMRSDRAQLNGSKIPARTMITIWRTTRALMHRIGKLLSVCTMTMMERRGG